MKIGTYRIIVDHINTLKNFESKKLSGNDIALFFITPVAAGVAVCILNLKIPKDVYNVSVTFFGIFIALLLNIQVAIFNIHQRKRDKSSDDRLSEINLDNIRIRNHLLRELNSNISYLVLFSCFALAIFLILFSTEWSFGFFQILSTFLYVHFFLTLLMVVKRSHSLFQKEYEDGN